MAVVRFRQAIVERDGDRPGTHGAEPRCGKLRRVPHEQQYAVSGSNAEPAQRRAGAAHLRGKLAVADGFIAAQQRDAPAAACEDALAEQQLRAVQGLLPHGAAW
jgi:hypothetical protein